MERNMVADVAKIYAVLNEFAAAWIDGELERWIALWIDDGIFLPPEKPRCVGKEQICREMKPRFDQFDMSNMTIDTEEVRIIGKQAFSHGTYTFDLIPKNGGETKRYCVKFLDILEKQVDGSWKIAIDCHNYFSPEEKASQ